MRCRYCACAAARACPPARRRDAQCDERGGQQDRRAEDQLAAEVDGELLAASGVGAGSRVMIVKMNAITK